MSTPGILTGEFFISGDEACAEGAIAAGCRFFAGYPITPATEIAERMARRLPQVQGMCLQMEDEIASMAAILGASWGGAKSMTATSGPGFSLMMENIGLGMMSETPCVVVNIMRAGPSTGLPTLVGQADVMQARWGSHGDYGVIALAPSSPQEMFNLTITAFNLSETYRLPVFVLGDEVVGHMSERVVIPPPEQIQRVSRKRPAPGQEGYLPFLADDDLVPAMACAGDGYHVHVTGLTHDEQGYPVITAPVHERLVRRLVDKIRLNAPAIFQTEAFGLEDAAVLVVAYGCTARAAREAVTRLRAGGRKVGLLRLITLWPFPEEQIRQLARQVQALIVPEINNGQMVYEVERCAGGACETVLMPLMGGTIHTPEDIIAAVEEYLP
ncbi:MAG: 2-oxoacid:acceptor oxidoreductase subunit alpha [Deltaproteobacteria bacterium]|nr:2-oxoacid:acceptor oxidoreductase subunit alpha [Deltaproteobacteria bacterium]